MKKMSSGILIFALSFIFVLSLRAPADEEPTWEQEPIRKVVRENLADIQQCYDMAIKKNPLRRLRGEVLVQWDVLKDGSVEKPHIHSQSTLKNKLLSSCIIKKIQAMKFPPPPAGTIANIIYPFHFSQRPANPK